MIKPIEENFVANVTHGDQHYICSVNDYTCTLIPEDENSSIEPLIFDFIPRQFAFGTDLDGNRIAIMIQNENPINKQVRSLFNIPNYIRFKNALLIKGEKTNIHSDDEYDLHTFDQITFVGGAVNAVFPPIQAIDLALLKQKEDGSYDIPFKLFKDHTHRFEMTLFGQELILIYSVNHPSINSSDKVFGQPESIISLRFKSSQKLIMIEKYYVMMKSFLSFCVAQENIVFSSVTIGRKTEQTDKEEYYRIGICKVRDEYKDYYKPDSNKSLQLLSFGENIVNALHIFADESKKPWLMFLPYDNQSRSYVTLDNVRNLCSSLEFEFNMNMHNKTKYFTSQKIEALTKAKRFLNDQLSNYFKMNPADKAIKDNAFASLKYMDLPFADKLTAMASSTIELVGNDYYQNVLNNDRIKKFKKIRDDITHRTLFEMGFDLAITYNALVVVNYICILRRIGLPEEMIKLVIDTLKMMR